MSNNRNPLYSAVNYALSAGMVASMGVAGVAFAQEDSAELDKVQVTGSRLKRTDIETAQPVTVIDRAEIDASGDVSVAQVLQTTVYNSFGSFRATSGYGSGYAAVNEASLRGLGSNRTLVLMDGKRMSTIPGNGNASQNLNQIPLDVVERIEILRDGASAIYGADAIAGVINIITRKDYEGMKVALHHEEGRGSHMNGTHSVTGGVSNAKGNVFYNLSIVDQRPQFHNELDYAADAPSVFGISSFGFPGSWITLSGDYAGANFVDPRCPLINGSDPDWPNSYRWDFVTFEAGNSTIGAERCGYNFAAVTKSTPDIRGVSLFVNSNYAVTDSINMTTKLLMTDSKTETRYAGTPVTGPYPTMSADNPNNPMPLYGLEPADILILMRSVPNGTRDTVNHAQDLNMNVAFTGFTDLMGGADWELGMQYVRNYTNSKTYNLVNKDIIQQDLDNGILDFFNVNGNYSDSVMLRANHTGLYEGQTDAIIFNGNMSFDLMDLPAGAAQMAVGFETQSIGFLQENDPESNRLVVAGTSGGDNIAAERDVTSVFFELGLPVTEMIEANIAGRFDDYSDFGSNFSPAANISFRPVDGLLVRATYGEGFRAPGFDEYYGNVSESFPSGTDFVGCNAGVSPCTPTQYRALFGGNTNLGPEESKTWTAGLVWEPMEDLNMELSFYHIEFTNWITTSTLAREFTAELNGQPNYVIRNADGSVNYVSLQYNNFEGVETEGVDLNLNYSMSLGDAGDLGMRLEHSTVTNYTLQRFSDSEPYDVAGEMGYPDGRTNFYVNWSMGDMFAAMQISNIAGQSEDIGGDIYEVDSHAEVDLQFGYNLPWNGKVTVGARNITDEDPEINADYYGWWPYDQTIYDTKGRVVYVRYEQDF